MLYEVITGQAYTLQTARYPGHRPEPASDTGGRHAKPQSDTGGGENIENIVATGQRRGKLGHLTLKIELAPKPVNGLGTGLGIDLDLVR